ncbi:hypothetical protein Tco_0220141, partial [Tanacetum coccineum]
TNKSKITRKTGKSEQARTRESEEYKAEARKVKPQSNPIKEKPIIGQQKSTKPIIGQQKSTKPISTFMKPQGPILQIPKVIYN